MPFLSKGKVARSYPEADGGVTVVAENALTGEKISQKVDMAVLATGMQPSLRLQGAPVALNLDGSGFVISDNDKGNDLQPVVPRKPPMLLLLLNHQLQLPSRQFRFPGGKNQWLKHIVHICVQVVASVMHSILTHSVELCQERCPWSARPIHCLCGAEGRSADRKGY